MIYGHDTKDGSMFGSLKNVLNKDWQNKSKNLIITLSTEKGKYKYQVFSTYSVEPEKYYINTEFKNNNEYYKFLNIIKDRSNYNYEVSINKKDKILTLSSCISMGKKRVVLHAKLTKNYN